MQVVGCQHLSNLLHAIPGRIEHKHSIAWLNAADQALEVRNAGVNEDDLRSAAMAVPVVTDGVNRASSRSSCKR